VGKTDCLFFDYNKMEHNSDRKLRIGITIGDLNGIGPEVLMKAFTDQRFRDLCIPVVYGSARVINIYRKILDLDKFNYQVVPNPGQARPGRVNLIDCIPDIDRVEIGQPSESGGLGAYYALKLAIEDAIHQQIDALVTLPVDKSTIQKHDADFIGHTEMLAKAFSVNMNLMLMVSDQLRLGLATNHLPLKDVSRNLSVQRIKSKIHLLDQSLKNDFNLQKRLIAVMGLNPHAGDNGLIGEEENLVLKEAITEAQKEGVSAYGPYPADGFFGSLQYRNFDGVLAMYHDQGLIPFKLIAGMRGVNFTAGMPFVRTSPAHGVAYDIAGKNEADPTGLIEAIYLAIDVCRNRIENRELQAGALNPDKKGLSRAQFEDPTESKTELPMED
jgi:4-hydroxythreonine-4-phosphate dehydrogenase